MFCQITIKLFATVIFANFKILSVEKFFKSSAPITGFPKIAVRGPARPGHVVSTFLAVWCICYIHKK